MEDCFEKTIRKIESIEKKWRYELSEEEDKEHSFGRIPEDGRKVALWSVPRTTGHFLKFITELIKPKIILELGCSAGYSTLFLAKGIKDVNGHVFTTEILKKKIEMAKEHFAEAKLDNKITLFEKDILEVLEKWDKKRKIDFVFMDSDKESYKIYFEKLLPLMNNNGLIIADNASKTRMADGTFHEPKEIKEFLETVKKDRKVESHLLEIDNGLLLIRKK